MSTLRHVHQGMELLSGLVSLAWAPDSFALAIG